MTLSTYAANALADHVNGRTQFALPTTYIALYTASPGISGGASTNEVGYTGYQRQACGTGGSSIFPAAGSGSTSISSQLAFPQSSGGGSFTVTHVGIVDSASGVGNLLDFGALAVPRTYGNGDTPTFSAGALTEAFS